MRFVAIFEDSPEMDAVRQAREPAHLSYLEAHRSVERDLASGLRVPQTKAARMPA
jgi:uncharacterized protein YciI